MALSSGNSLLPTKPFQTHKPSLSTNPNSIRFVQRISAVHSADQPKNPIVSDKPPKPTSSVTAAAAATATAVQSVTNNTVLNKWAIDSWKTKKALQLPEYPNKEELESVLETLDAFPPIVFAGEARNLEERLGEAAMGKAFLLQGGDCAESFKEFNANNIRDTFRIILQMGAVLMFGGQVPVIKVTFFASFYLFIYTSTKFFLDLKLLHLKFTTHFSSI